MSVYSFEKAVQISNSLSFVDKIRLLEHLSVSLRHDLEVEAYKQMPREQFIDLTYGSLADDPIERNQPFYPDRGDKIE